MLLSIQNVGKIKKADIEISGLTVIAGENDTGKSTAGKLIFSIIKAFARYEQDFNENKTQRVNELIERLYLLIRRAGLTEKANMRLRDDFYPPRFFKELETFIENKNQISIFEDIKDIYIRQIIDLKIDSLGKNVRDKKTLMHLTKCLKEIEDLILKKDTEVGKIKKALGKAFISEFYNDLSPKGKKGKSSIVLSENNTSIIDIELLKNEISKLSLKEKIFYNDATFVESPLVIQLYDAINSASTFFELSEDLNSTRRLATFGKHKVSLHNKDLINKLKEAEYFERGLLKSSNKSQRILKTIESIISGSLEYSEKDQDFIYTKNSGKNKHRIRAINQASGIKSFGLISLLIQSGRINEQSFLILDEPETHLHPKWQIEYAKVLVELLKNNIPILITTHSPYLIQAIKVYSEKQNLLHRVNFYLAEEGIASLNSSNISNVNNDLNRVFKKLSTPLEDLLWE